MTERETTKGAMTAKLLCKNWRRNPPIVTRGNWRMRKAGISHNKAGKIAASTRKKKVNASLVIGCNLCSQLSPGKNKVLPRILRIKPLIKNTRARDRGLVLIRKSRYLFLRVDFFGADAFSPANR